MSARTATFVSPIVASLLAGAPFAATSHGATNPAETSCLSGPKGVAPQGGHWYYRVDRDTKRHCWYVGDARQKKARTAAEHTQPAAPVASPADTAIQPSIANARAELLSPQTRAEETNAATAQQAVPAMIANANQRANAPDANAQRSIIASRWPESSSVNAPAVLGPSADNSSASSTLSLPSPPPVAVAFPAADISSQRQTSQRDAGSIQMLLAVILGALALAGLMGSAIFKFGSSQRVNRRGAGLDRPAAVPMRSAGLPLELWGADDPDERIAQMLQRQARSAAT